jgi:hypothetical protein
MSGARELLRLHLKAMLCRAPKRMVTWSRSSRMSPIDTSRGLVMTTDISSRAERQRIAHLVFGRPRPKPPKSSRRRRVHPDLLEPAIEAAVSQREAFSHKAQGTPETHAHAARARKRQGTLARLHASGAIDAHQLAMAEAIALAFAQVTGPVAVRTATLAPRGSAVHGGAEIEARSRILTERKYTAWRAAMGADAAMLLAIIVDDVSIVAAGRRWRRSTRTVRGVLIAGLNGWWRSI